jgi:hypothetical protein
MPTTATMPRPRNKQNPEDKAPVAISIRFPPAIYVKLGKVADRERRSLTSQVLYIVERFLEEHPDGND